MTWQGKRRAQLPADWAHRRKARLELDGFRCTHVEQLVVGEAMENPHYVRGELRTVRCPHSATDVHHALDAHDHRIESLRSLCVEHYKLETQREAQQFSQRCEAAEPRRITERVFVEFLHERVDRPTALRMVMRVAELSRR